MPVEITKIELSWTHPSVFDHALDRRQHHGMSDCRERGGPQLARAADRQEKEI